MQIGIPMKGLRRNDDAMKTYSWYSKQLTQTASKYTVFLHTGIFTHIKKGVFTV